MFKELNDLEELIKGNRDLRKMEDLMSITNETMINQTKAAQDLSSKITSINQEAEKAVMALSFYDDESSTITKKEWLQQIAEDNEDEEANVENEGKLRSHEEEKSSIYNRLEEMQQQMKNFAQNIEFKLDSVYKSGASKKFGFDDVVNEANKDADILNKSEQE